MKCHVHSCQSPIYAKGYCRPHYKCFHRIGKPIPDRLTLHGSIEKKFSIRSNGRNENGCWIWSGKKDLDGYGSIRDGLKMKRAHRVSWEIHRGPIPPGAHVLHKCNNPACVNPSHLSIGDHKENMSDRKANGRPWHSPASRAGLSRVMKGRKIEWKEQIAAANQKLTAHQCMTILRRLAGGEKGKDLADEYHVHRTTISKVKMGTYNPLS
jgi:hypothetical protein